MKAWLERSWSNLGAKLSAPDEWDEEKEEREYQEQEIQARLEKEKRYQRGETDGFRAVR